MFLGIDLGTSNSVVAGIVDGAVRVFRPVDGGDVLPSAIFFDKRGHKLYGRRAHDQAMLSPENVAMGFKRLLGSSTKIDVAGAGLALTAEECTAEILTQLLAQVTTETGNRPIAGAVITVPASFNQMQREATMRAAATAGLGRVALIDEPTAAALSALATGQSSGQFLIYDLGGGTFDLALVQSLNGQITPLAHQGISMLGGRDFDRMLVNEVVRPWLVTQFDLPDNFQRDPAFRRLIRVAHVAAEKAKIDLSVNAQTTIFASDDEVRMTDASGTDMYLEIPITRGQYEKMLHGPIMQTIELTRQVLAENNYTHENIDKIVFVGGPSRTPLVREMVARELGIPTDMKVDPMTAVALGAAYYAAAYDWGASLPAGPADAAALASANAVDHPLQLDFTARTHLAETPVTVRVMGDAAPIAAVQIEGADGWASEILDLDDGMVIDVALRQDGALDFKLCCYDKRDQHLSNFDRPFTITRTLVAAPTIPATQTIAVKVLDHHQGDSNALFPLIARGTPLPATGQSKFAAVRDLAAGSVDQLSFELFQVEYPERVELNLCVGVFRITGADLPAGYAIKPRDPIVFNWRMNESGLLQATVTLPQASGGKPVELRAPRFYAPQAGEQNFSGPIARDFADALLRQAEEEGGDLAAALGPLAGSDLTQLRVRWQEQRAALAEASGDAETTRRVSEQARFIRQDIARLARKYRPSILQRQLGKLAAIFNRMGRAQATPDELARFDNHQQKAQQIIDDGDAMALNDADRHLAEMRDIFFAAAWRDDAYVIMWLKRLTSEPYLFPDQADFQRLIAAAEKAMAAKDFVALRGVVNQLLAARVALSSNDTAHELASIARA